jgi:hypothetical protein
MQSEFESFKMWTSMNSLGLYASVLVKEEEHSDLS